MTTKTSIFLLVILLFGPFKPSLERSNISLADNCPCDTAKALYTVMSKDFNRIVQYDTTAFSTDSFYRISAEENRRLWYRDVQNPMPTRFTSRWNDYHLYNYRANNLDFVSYFEKQSFVEVAFQFGPNNDLWAYHIFVVKKLDCCYLFTRSYFRHARFTYKAYAIIDQAKVDSLFEVLEPINKVHVDTTESWTYRGYFVDNRKKNKFYIDFEKEKTDSHHNPKKEIIELYNFVDKRIKWKETYSQ